MIMDLYELMAALEHKTAHSDLIWAGYSVRYFAQSGRVLYTTYENAITKRAVIIQWAWDNDKGWQVKYQHSGEM